MTGAASVGFLLLCVASYVVACDLLRAPRMHRLRTRFVCERNRNRFGELRTRLMRLAITGEVNPRSEIFALIYEGTTVLMRNPYNFEAAAQAVLLKIPAPPEEQRQRGPRPTEQEGEIVRELAKRIDLLCRDYSKVYAVLAWILERLTKRLPSADKMPPLWLAILSRAQEKRIGSIFEARKLLERTAKLAA